MKQTTQVLHLFCNSAPEAGKRLERAASPGYWLPHSRRTPGVGGSVPSDRRDRGNIILHSTGNAPPSLPANQPVQITPGASDSPAALTWGGQQLSTPADASPRAAQNSGQVVGCGCGRGRGGVSVRGSPSEPRGRALSVHLAALVPTL